MQASRSFNWSTSGLNWRAAPYESPSPNLVALLQYLTSTFGGRSLGIHGNREVRFGSSISPHAFGAALDWRWEAHAGVTPINRWLSRKELDEVVLPFLIENSEALGIGTIVDKGRVWKGGRGWRNWAGSNYYSGWIHIETLPDRFDDATPIVERIAPPMPPFNPEAGQFSLWPLAVKQLTVRGATGDHVRYLQGVLRKFTDINVTGVFDEVTEQRVRDTQQFWGLTVDGRVGRQTWATIDWLAGL